MQDHTKGHAGPCPPFYLETDGIVFGPSIGLKPLASKKAALLSQILDPTIQPPDFLSKLHSNFLFTHYKSNIIHILYFHKDVLLQ